MGLFATTSDLTLRSLPGRNVDRPNRTRRPAWRIAAAAIVLPLLVGGGVLVGGSPSPTGSSASLAHAFLDVCGNPGGTEAQPGAADGGIDGASVRLSETSNRSSLIDVSSQFTAYEWYGTAGLRWEEHAWSELGDSVGCFLTANLMSVVPSMVLELNNTVSDLTGTFVALATSLNLVGALLFAEGGALLTLVQNLKDDLFLEFLVPIVVLASIGVAWKGLVQRRSRDAIQDIVWMFLAAAAAVTFMTNPLWFAKTLDDVAVNTGQFVTNQFIGAAASESGDLLCSVGTNADPSSTSLASSSAARSMQCNVWLAFAYTPWAAGQFGDDSGTELEVAASDPAFRGFTTLPLMVLETQTNTFGDRSFTGDVDAVKGGQWNDVVTAVTAAESSDELSPAMLSAFAGRDPAQRMNLAFTALIASLTVGAPLLILGASVLLQQVLFIFLIIAAPLYLTFGVNPGLGRRVALGWVEMLLSTVLKRIVLSAMVGLLLAYYSLVISNSQIFTFADIALIGAGGFTLTALLRALILLLGAIAIFMLLRTLMKKAGSAINLNGLRINDNGRTSALAAATGAGAATAVVSGLGAKAQGDGFWRGAARGYSGPQPAGVRTAVGAFTGKRDGGRPTVPEPSLAPDPAQLPEPAPSDGSSAPIPRPEPQVQAPAQPAPRPQPQFQPQPQGAPQPQRPVAQPAPQAPVTGSGQGGQSPAADGPRRPTL
jgi:hypothetical protein